jgi:hypothetical protein
VAAGGLLIVAVLVVGGVGRRARLRAAGGRAAARPGRAAVLLLRLVSFWRLAFSKLSDSAGAVDSAADPALPLR